MLKAIRDNEPRAISLGYRADQYKLVVFVLSATLAGLAGATKAIVFQLASLTDVNWPMSGEVVLMTLVGGIGTVFGPIVGAARHRRHGELPRQLGAWVTVVQGVIFVALRPALPRGHRRRHRQAHQAAAVAGLAAAESGFLKIVLDNPGTMSYVSLVPSAGGRSREASLGWDGSGACGRGHANPGLGRPRPIRGSCVPPRLIRPPRTTAGPP